MSGQIRLDTNLEKAHAMKNEDKVFRYNGILYPIIRTPEENLKALVNLEARPDDVMLVAFPKCGFNWMFGVLKKIVAAVKGTESQIMVHPLIEFLSPAKQQMLADLPSPRVLGTHLLPQNMPSSFFAKKTKIVVMFRNPKDTAVSYFHFTNNNPVLQTAESWDKFYSDFMQGEVPWGSYFDYALAWEEHINDPNVLVVIFEDMKQNLCKGIERITQFYGYSLTEEQVQSIAKASGFEAMKESSRSTYGQMADIIFRKGEVGDWKNLFTADQSQEMDAAFEKHLAGTMLGTKLKYDVYCK
ncbi:sulfotransferase 6B1-like [Brienomyrus brachyistius]|uniref:sulfotransferase 6B1-like n=1 Tax=Brienomyrus brachyistius TaxID=42636 RepID=UPI0020B28F93|nr:sulfotransferase 6B1-like [Brienomyrus brachyistius]